MLIGIDKMGKENVKKDVVEIPTILLNEEGYPTQEYLNFIKNYHPEKISIKTFVETISKGWNHRDWGFKLGRKYKGIRKLELHTGGWSGNEDVIEAIIENIYLTHFSMKYKMWRTGGHYYFEVNWE